ncbi:HAD-IA family hydrolase, partial [archaeon]|nr:HAD-IA family hydrolase [archaeon]
NKYILSNTNPLHGEFLKKKFPQLFKIAKISFLSYEIKMRKPQSKIFKFLIKELNIKPEEILLIDDKRKTLDEAKKFNIKTLLCDNPKELKNKLNKIL